MQVNSGDSILISERKISFSPFPSMAKYIQIGNTIQVLLDGRKNQYGVPELLLKYAKRNCRSASENKTYLIDDTARTIHLFALADEWCQKNG